MIWRVTLIVLLMFMFVGATLNKEDTTQEQMDNLTEKMSYDNLNISTRFQSESNNQNNTFLIRSVYKYADFLGFVMVEGAKVSVNFGYNNPKYNFNLMWKLMFLSCFAVLIIPLIYVLLFIGYGIYIIVNWIKSRRLIKNVQSKKKNKT